MRAFIVKLLNCLIVILLFSLITNYYLPITQVHAYTEKTYYLHQDHLGSVIAVTDETGTLVSQSKYSPYGSQLPTTNYQLPTERSYTGQISDKNTTLAYYNARYYDPILGRFISADSVNDQQNRYNYVGGNPVSRNDPGGNMAISDEGGGGGEIYNDDKEYNSASNKYRSNFMVSTHSMRYQKEAEPGDFPGSNMSCGPTALSIGFSISRNDQYSPSDITKEMIGMNLFNIETGSIFPDLNKYAQSKGFTPDYHSHEANTLEDFMNNLKQNNMPAIVAVKTGFRLNNEGPKNTVGHFVIAVGLDKIKDKNYIIFSDPYEKGTMRTIDFSNGYPYDYWRQDYNRENYMDENNKLGLFFKDQYTYVAEERFLESFLEYGASYMFLTPNQEQRNNRNNKADTAKQVRSSIIQAE